jgi:thioesterase domain-containing protein
MDTMMLYPSIRGLAQSIREETLLSRLECIVKLNKGGNEKNIFIIHPLHGMVYPYRELAGLLEKDFNVYGIQARGMFKNSKLPENLDELVEVYLQEIRTVQEEGPYIIAGYCFGDMVGYKLVKKLEDMNVPVETFIMFDELAFIPLHVLEYYRQQRIIDSLLKPVNTLLDIFRKAKGGEGRGIVEEAGEEPEDNDDNEAGAELSPKKLKIRAKMNINKLNKRYWRGSAFSRTTGIIKCPILAIKAENTHFTVFEEDMAKLTLGKLIFVEIPGDHSSIFRYPHVEQLAETIKNNV